MDKKNESNSINLANLYFELKNRSITDRGRLFYRSIKPLNASSQYFRKIVSPMDREIEIIDKNGEKRKMLMFGSNNYLGLANHPKLSGKIQNYIKKYGIGIAGPSILNGYSELMQKVEAKINRLKGCEDSLIFSSGYNANMGLICGLCQPDDIIIADEYCHASLNDGIKIAGCKVKRFKHNDIDHLEWLLNNQIHEQNKIVAVEGIYSMDGDMAPLDKIIPLCKKYNAFLFLDDAHGTGVVGENGEGTHSIFPIDYDKMLIVGTFSKSFAVTGGFIAGNRELIYYLRYNARSYVFSAALPPISLSTILSCFEIIEEENWRIPLVHENVKYLVKNLSKFGFCSEPKAGIIALKIPEGADIRSMALKYHKAGVFVNAIEYPAVSVNKQRFRISCISSHTKQDLDKLIDVTERIYRPFLNQANESINNYKQQFI